MRLPALFPVDRNTGNKAYRSERNKILGLDNVLHKRVIGQNEAVSKVTDTIIRSKAGIKRQKQSRLAPLCSLGLQALARQSLPRRLPKHCLMMKIIWVRIDMSEYGEVLGIPPDQTPPGYVGYERKAASLRKLCAATPTTSFCFDEIEKAHPDVFNVLLQVLDDGRITDSQGPYRRL